MTSLRRGVTLAQPLGRIGATRQTLASEQEMWTQEIRKVAEQVSKESRDGIAKAVREALQAAKEKSGSES